METTDSNPKIAHKNESYSLPKIRTRSKIKPLEDKIQTLTNENESMLEEMYEKGLRTRPTIMTKIEEKEAETLEYIKYCLDECEKETGRILIISPTVYTI